MIQLKIGIWRIEARVVEDVECIRLEFQGEALRELEILEDREIETRLERRAENVAPVASVTGFQRVANGCPRRSGAAGRNSALARAQERNREIIRIDIGNPDSGKRPRREGIVGSALRSLLGRDSGRQRKNRIGDEVVRAEDKCSQPIPRNR